MAFIRSSSLCSICSGRFKLFLKGDKAVITDDICDAVLDSCASSFEKLMQFLEGMARFAQGLRSTVQWKMFSKNTLLKTTELMAALTKKIRDLKVSDLMEDYLKNHQVRSLVSRQLCSLLINIASPSFFFQTSSILKKYNLDIFSQMKAELDAEIAKILEEEKRLKLQAEAKAKEAREKIVQNTNGVKEIQTKDETTNRKLLLSLLSPTGVLSSSSFGRRSEAGSTTGRCLQLGNTTSNWVPSNYSSNGTASLTNLTQNFLLGDVVVVPSPPGKPTTDSSYQSFTGATGTNGNEALHHFIMPMNLTSKFP